jgi:hypothetical protein
MGRRKKHLPIDSGEEKAVSTPPLKSDKDNSQNVKNHQDQLLLNLLFPSKLEANNVRAGVVCWQASGPTGVRRGCSMVGRGGMQTCHLDE